MKIAPKRGLTKGTVRRAEQFVLKTKLIPPVLKENIVLRPQLISTLAENLNKRLILVVADAGYGKTVLLTQLIKDRCLPVVFYDLGKEDNDLEVFLSYLTYGLEQLQPDLVRHTSGLLRRGIDVNKNYELVMGTLVNELTEKRTEELFIMLDDYHVFTADSMVHKALDHFINIMPNTVHMVIASRTEPSFNSLSKWRSKQALFEFSRKELSFTKSDIKSLINCVYGVILSKDELDQVFKHTEGWITGVQLILQSAGKDKKTVKETFNGYLAAHQPLFDYFANEILARECAEVQDFLKNSSILKIMTPGACDAILGLRTSQRLLKDLERRHLFLSTVGKGEYKYHNLFQEFLREKITDKNFEKDLHLRAARYFKHQDQIEEAIQHYLEVGYYEWAGKLIAQIEGRMHNQARFTTLGTWLVQMPNDVLYKQPKLLTTLGRLNVMQGNRQQAEKLFKRAEQLFSKKTDRVALAELLKAYASLLLDDESRHEDALKIIRKALKFCPAGEDKLKIEILNTIGRVWRRDWDFNKAKPYLLKAYRIAERIKDANQMITIANNLALQYVTQGEIRTAFRIFKQLIDLNGDNYWINVGIVFNNAASNALALGKIEWAEQCLDKGWTICGSHEDLRSKTALHRASGHLYMQKAQWDLAEQHLLKAQGMAAKMNWIPMEFVIFRTMSRFYRYRGDMSKAEEYLNLMWQRLDKRDSPNEATLLIEMGCLYIAHGQFEKAAKVIKTSSRLIRKYGLNVLKFYSFLINSAIALEQKEKQKALHFLKRTFRIAKVKGYDGLLINELWHNPRLAQFVQERSIERNYLVTLNIPRDKPKVHLSIQSFGELRLFDRHGKLISITWRTEKAKSLFAFLVVHRSVPLHREVILEYLWPGFAKDRAHGNFRTTASRMRQSLTKALSGALSQNEIFISQHKKYHLLPEVQLCVDTEEFELLLKEAERTGSNEEKVKIIHQALNLYKGDYLPEIYDSWSDILRRRFREKWLNALHWLAEYSVGKGDNLASVAACETYLSIDPLSEVVVRLYMTSLGRLGRLSAVKTCYKSLKHLLRQELRSTPSRETEDLYLSLLRIQPQK